MKKFIAITSFIAIIFLFFVFFIIKDTESHSVKSFYDAKKYLPSIWSENQKTFYCKCDYVGKEIDLSSCAFKQQKPTIRGKQIEWEHIVSASRFGKQFLEWKFGNPLCETKGRTCVRKIRANFRKMEGDLYNLVPSVGAINQARSNLEFGIIIGEERRFGTCDFEVENKIVEPRQKIRGDIARTYFYMQSEYPGYIKLTDKERKMFTRWNIDDPVDEWEYERARMIEKIQGNKNRFIY